MLESSNVGKDGNCIDLAPKTSGNVVAPDTRSHILTPQMVWKQVDSIMIDLSEQEICIKCDKGGKLLLCSVNGCPLAIHESCMGCSPEFDDSGNFLCPYCLYRQATDEIRAAREKALLAQKALLIYMERENNANQSKRKAGTVEGKEPAVSAVRNLGSGESENRMRSNNIQNQSASPEKTPSGVAAACTVNNSPSGEINMPISAKEDACREDAPQTHTDHRKMLVEDVRSCEVLEEFDDLQQERAVEGQPQAGYSRDTHVGDVLTSRKELNLSEKEIGENAEAREVNGGKRLKTTLTLRTVQEPTFVVHEEFTKGMETSGSIVEDTENVGILRRHVRDVYKQQSAQLQTVNLPKRSLPLELVTKEAKGDKSPGVMSKQIEVPSNPR